MSKTIEAWHFLRSDRKMRWGDNRRALLPGVTVSVEGKPDLCTHGLHASTRLADALNYAPGPILCRVSVGGEIIDGGDKIVGSERTILWMADASEMLRDFAHLQALSVGHLWPMTEVVRNYLMTGRESARGAAWAAARAAASDAAWAAARAAARGAAWAAARGAARGAASDAAWAAARGAASDAASVAASDAASVAAWAAANDQLELMAWMLCGPETAQFPQ